MPHFFVLSELMVAIELPSSCLRLFWKLILGGCFVTVVVLALQGEPDGIGACVEVVQEGEEPALGGWGDAS